METNDQMPPSIPLMCLLCVDPRELYNPYYLGKHSRNVFLSHFCSEHLLELVQDVLHEVSHRGLGHIVPLELIKPDSPA